LPKPIKTTKVISKRARGIESRVIFGQSFDAEAFDIRRRIIEHNLRTKKFPPAQRQSIERRFQLFEEYKKPIIIRGRRGTEGTATLSISSDKYSRKEHPEILPDLSAEIMGKMKNELIAAAYNNPNPNTSSELLKKIRKSSTIGELRCHITKDNIWPNNKGLGTKAFEELEADAKELGAEIIYASAAVSNKAVLKIFKNRGWTLIGKGDVDDSPQMITYAKFLS
jgi:hypothetical protein